MNYIHKLQAENKELKRANQQIDYALVGFLQYLQSAKFTGTEGGERKDWISTGEVERFITHLRGELGAKD